MAYKHEHIVHTLCVTVKNICAPRYLSAATILLLQFAALENNAQYITGYIQHTSTSTWLSALTVLDATVFSCQTGDTAIQEAG